MKESARAAAPRRGRWRARASSGPSSPGSSAHRTAAGCPHYPGGAREAHPRPGRRHSWDDVSAAFWRRYSESSTYTKHVLSSDVLDRCAAACWRVCGARVRWRGSSLCARRFVDDRGRLHTRRLLTKTNKKPRWMDAVRVLSRCWRLACAGGGRFSPSPGG